MPRQSSATRAPAQLLAAAVRAFQGLSDFCTAAATARMWAHRITIIIAAHSGRR